LARRATVVDPGTFSLDVMPIASCASPQTIKLDFDAAYRGHTSGTMYHRTWSGTVTVTPH